MKVILLHNAKAGTGKGPSAEDLLRSIRDAGHQVTYQATAEKGAKWTLLEPADLVIAAGGDGTVRKAALGVAGRGIPIAILPLGTANNLARNFSIDAMPEEIIHNLNTCERRRLDVWLASGPWGKLPFIEAAGAGLLAGLIHHLTHPGRTVAAPSLEDARGTLCQLLEGHRAERWAIRTDEQQFSEKILLLETMNICTAGPNLKLAPLSDPGDGQLEVVLLKERGRRAFIEYLASTARGREEPAPVDQIRARRLHLHTAGPAALHIDDRAWFIESQTNNRDDEAAGQGGISIAIEPAAEPIEVLVPR